MSIKKIPCGGFMYDNETIEFVDGVIKGKEEVLKRKVRYDVQSDNFYWDDERSFLDTIHEMQLHNDKILVLYNDMFGIPETYIAMCAGGSQNPTLIIKDHPIFNAVNNKLIILVTEYTISNTESYHTNHRYELTDLTVKDIHD